MSDLHKLRYKVVSFSSEDADYPAAQLNTVSPSTRGWQSVRFCPYPQELGFEILDGYVQISQIQLLSHQSKISSKVEIFIGEGGSYRTATFKRLGYLSLDGNERSNFQARELKTVFIDHAGSYIKLLINENHVNKQNLYNQVGVIAVSLMGVDDPYAAGAKGSAVSKNPYNDLSIDINLDPLTANKLRQLSDAKARAVEGEDYSTAKQIKLVEQDLKAMGSKLAQLDMAKSDAVMAEDYDLAKDIKDQSDALRRQIEDNIMKINIPGVAQGKPLSARGRTQQSPAPQAQSQAQAPAHSTPTFKAEERAPYEGSPEDPYEEKGEYEYAEESFEGAEDMSLPVTERPIKPKANTYDPTVGGIDDDPNSFRGSTKAAKAVEQFPAGQHPLEGVPGFDALPSPEALAGKSRETSEQGGITALIGEYRARCLFSKTWVLREAALQKVLLMVTKEIAQEPGLGAALPALAVIARVAVEDKIQQVLFGGVNLMDEVFEHLKR
ncbi:hypothetical protein B484DRAFT_407424 [Ochromonadaceae sp. CCMP2298]|nr:hypothetical protein B484DRAFT_407424 [Ochromonadaceae sp. CCMP2298]